MPIDITELVDPRHTAVVVNECQQGILGERSVLPAVAEETRWVLPNVGRLVRGAREAGADVLHALAARRADGRGARSGLLVERHAGGVGSGLTPEEFATVMPEIGVEESDFVVTRYGGMGGLSGSGAVTILRNLGMRTLVVCGVTLNAGVLSMMMYGLDEGFDVVVVSDASGGFPRSYGEDILRYTVRPFAPIATVDDVLAAWSATRRGRQDAPPARASSTRPGR
ncbi:MAG TPA: isochorismatase family protein [Acidimicrobiales bacterium]|nr:isochorismatase family protein [Acidimicrobiales bacterium]